MCGACSHLSLAPFSDRCAFPPSRLLPLHSAQLQQYKGYKDDAERLSEVAATYRLDSAQLNRQVQMRRWDSYRACRPSLPVDG